MTGPGPHRSPGLIVCATLDVQDHTHMMRLPSLFHAFAALCAFIAAGFGGSALATDSSGSRITTYRDTRLPGRLVVNSVLGNAYAFDLQTGERYALPRLSANRAPSRDQWAAGSGPFILRWYSNVTAHGKVPIFIFDSRSWTKVGQLWVNSEFSAPKLSPDGRYVLSFWQDDARGEGPKDQRLTVFDAQSGRPVKRGSRLDGKLMVGDPASWLPDGRYVYRVARKLYVSSPLTKTENLLANLPLPDNVMVGGPAAGGSLAVSPDGTRLAFTIGESRRESRDMHIWVVNLDGTGLHRLTSPPDPRSALHFEFGSPTWSPDGRWVAGVLYMKGSTTAPVFPPDDTVAPAWKVTGTTGCSSSPVFVVPANAENVAISWPAYDARYGVKVKVPSGKAGEWLSSCESIEWLP